MWHRGLAALRHVGSSQTRVRTRVPGFLTTERFLTTVPPGRPWPGYSYLVCCGANGTSFLYRSGGTINELSVTRTLEMGQKPRTLVPNRRSEAQKIKLFHWITWMQVLGTRTAGNNNVHSLTAYFHMKLKLYQHKNALSALEETSKLWKNLDDSTRKSRV